MREVLTKEKREKFRYFVGTECFKCQLQESEMGERFSQGFTMIISQSEEPFVSKLAKTINVYVLAK